MVKIIRREWTSRGGLNNGNASMPDWLRLVFASVKPHIHKDFVGQIEINIFKGGISNVMVKQSYEEEVVTTR
jgi:hypothetical protein